MSTAPSSTSRPRARARGDATRERILDAVLAIIAEGGTRAVTYRAIARRADVSLGVMTYHFPTHRDLLASALRLHLTRLRETARDVPIASVLDAPSDEKAETIFGLLRTMAQTDRVRYLAEFELTLELARDAELRAQIERATDDTRALAVELLQKSGSPEPDADATLISATMEGLLLSWLSRPDDQVHQERIRAAIQRLTELLFP